MSYGTGRFSNLDLPDPTLTYVARRQIKHHDLVFKPGDPITAADVGDRHLVKYIRARMAHLPVAPGQAVPPEAGAALLQEPRASEPTGAGLDDLQQGVAGPEDGGRVLIEKPAPEPEPAPVDEAPDLETMTKAQLSALIDERGLRVDKRLPVGAMRAKVAAALAA